MIHSPIWKSCELVPSSHDLVYLFIFIVLLIGMLFIAMKHLDHHQLGTLMIQTVIWTFQCSNALKNCKKADRVLHGMLIYEIARHIMHLNTEYMRNTEYTLNCTFPKGIGSINVTVIQNDDPVEILKFELDPEKSIRVSLFTQNE